MKIIKKEIKECEFTDSKKTTVLDLTYSHMGEQWRILIKDYKEDTYKDILKQLRVKVRNLYVEQKLKSEA